MNMAQFYEEMSDYLKACFSIFIGQQYYFIINQLTVVDVLVVLSLSSTTFYKIVALRSLRVEPLLLLMLHRVLWHVSLIYRRGCRVLQHTSRWEVARRW